MTTLGSVLTRSPDGELSSLIPQPTRDMKLSVLLLLLLLKTFSDGLTIGGHAVRRRVARTQDDNEEPLFALSVDLGIASNNSTNSTDYDILASQIWPASRQLAYDWPQITDSFPWQLQRVCELGAGSGLVGLAAARASPLADVYITDVDDLSSLLVDAAAAEQGLTNVRTGHFDLCDAGELPADVDLYIMSDIFVTTEVAAGAARRCVEALAAGACVIVAAQAERVARETFLSHLRATAAEEHDGPVVMPVVRGAEGGAAGSAGVLGPRHADAAAALERGWCAESLSWPLSLLDVDEGRVPY